MQERKPSRRKCARVGSRGPSEAAGLSTCCSALNIQTSKRGKSLRATANIFSAQPAGSARCTPHSSRAAESVKRMSTGGALLWRHHCVKRSWKPNRFLPVCPQQQIHHFSRQPRTRSRPLLRAQDIEGTNCLRFQQQQFRAKWRFILYPRPPAFFRHARLWKHKTCQQTTAGI